MATPAATSRPLRALERSANPYLRGCSRRRRWSGSQSASWASAPLSWVSSLAAPPSSGARRPPGRVRGADSRVRRDEVLCAIVLIVACGAVDAMAERTDNRGRRLAQSAVRGRAALAARPAATLLLLYFSKDLILRRAKICPCAGGRRARARAGYPGSPRVGSPWSARAAYPGHPAPQVRARAAYPGPECASVASLWITGRATYPGLRATYPGLRAGSPGA